MLALPPTRPGGFEAMLTLPPGEKPTPVTRNTSDCPVTPLVALSETPLSRNGADALKPVLRPVSETAYAPGTATVSGTDSETLPLSSACVTVFGHGPPTISTVS